MTLQQSRRLQSLLLGTLAWAIALLIIVLNVNLLSTVLLG